MWGILKRFFKRKAKKQKGKKPGLGGEGKQREETWQKPELPGDAILPRATDGGVSVSNHVEDQNPTSPAVKPLWGASHQQKSNYVLPTHEVTTHAGFGSWLSTFRPAPTSEDEEKRNVERLENFVPLKSQGAGGYVPPPPGPGPAVELDASEPDASGNYAVVFEGSLRTAGVAHAQLSLPPGVPVTDIIRSLHDQGFDDVFGLSPDGAPGLAVGPSTHISNPRLITVTSGPSCYSFENGYLINSHETFASFFNASIAQPKHIDAMQANHDLEIDGGKLRISFHRTLRVPETGETHDLPYDFGEFPLFNVANYASRMPGDMAQKGGVFLPLYQREAMYIQFDSASQENAPQYAIKVFVGGVNAISGKTWDQKSDEQDYIVVPQQPWLDGIATAPGVVKQFVAMPLGSGYSVEKQVTGKEDTGGIQIEIVPAYNYEFGIASVREFSGHPVPSGAARWIDQKGSPQDNGRSPGARLYMKDFRDLNERGRSGNGHQVHGQVGHVFYHILPSAMDQDSQNQYITGCYGKPTERPAILRDLLDLSSQRPRPGIPFRVKVSHTLTIIVQHDGSLERPIEDTFKIKLSPFAHVSQLEDAINKLISKKPPLRNAEYVMKYNGTVLYRHDQTLWEHGMRDTVTIQYLCPSAASYQQPAEIPSQTGTYSRQKKRQGQSVYRPEHTQTEYGNRQRESLRESAWDDPQYATPEWRGGAPTPLDETASPQSPAEMPGESRESLDSRPERWEEVYNEDIFFGENSEWQPLPGAARRKYHPTRLSDTVDEQSPERRREGDYKDVSLAPELAGSLPPQNSPQATPAPNWDMGIAAGGQISQNIVPDTRSRREWNLTLARTLNIQILNSVAFEACTGMLTPQTPIDADTYVKAGLPFFKIHEEGEATVGGGGFDVEIETVGQIDAGKGVKMGVSIDPNNPTACLRCKVNLCDSILRRCNHTFCSTCVRDVMTDGKTVMCAFCNEKADMVLGISAPMAAPGKETPVLTNIVVLQPLKSAEL